MIHVVTTAKAALACLAVLAAGISFTKPPAARPQ